MKSICKASSPQEKKEKMTLKDYIKLTIKVEEG